MLYFPTFAERTAEAQLHRELSASAGLTRRWLSNRGGASDGGVGPRGEIAAHLAVLPIVRVGAYAAAELAPQGDADRSFFSVGGRLKLTPPAPLEIGSRTWLFVGAGGVFAHAPSSSMASMALGGGAPALALAPASGRYLEIPFGVGGSHRVARHGSIQAEIGARWGLAFTGPLYASSGRAATDATGAPSLAPSTGVDRWAVGFSIGFVADP